MRLGMGDVICGQATTTALNGCWAMWLKATEHFYYHINFRIMALLDCTLYCSVVMDFSNKNIMCMKIIYQGQQPSVIGRLESGPTVANVYSKY